MAGNTASSGERGDLVQPSLSCDSKELSAKSLPSLHQKLVTEAKGSIGAYVGDLGFYFGTSVCIPSVCAAIPHASVLTFSGTMITYLLNTGYSLNMVTGAKASGAVFEIGSTFIFPRAVAIFSPLSTARHAAEWYDLAEHQDMEAPSLLSRNDDRRGDPEDQDVELARNGPDVERGIIKVGLWAMSGLVLSLVST